MENLKGKVAVVTGSASGIGLCTSASLARRGVCVVMADKNAEMLGNAAAALMSEGLEVHDVEADVASFASMQNLANVAYDRFGKVNIVHLNAGVAGNASFFDDVTDNWERIVDINLLGVVWGIKAFVSRMIESGEEGLILATSSGAGAEGLNYGASGYAATKISVMAIMEALHGQLRDRKANVRSALVFPPLTATRLAGDPAMMEHIEAHLNSTGVPSVLIQPEMVADMVVDGIEKGRFYIGATRENSARIFGGAISEEFFQWHERMVRGRADAQIGDGKPDAFLW